MADFIKNNMDTLANTALYIARETRHDQSFNSVQQELFRRFIACRGQIAGEVAERYPEFSVVPQLIDTNNTIMKNSPEANGLEFVPLLSKELDLLLSFYTSADWYDDPDYVSLLLVYSCWKCKDYKSQVESFIQELFSSLDQHESLSGGAKINLTMAMWMWNYRDFQNRVMTLGSQNITDNNHVSQSANYSSNNTSDAKYSAGSRKAAAAAYWAKNKKSQRADGFNSNKGSQRAGYIENNMEPLAQVATHLATNNPLNDLSAPTIEGSLMLEWMSRRAGVAAIIAQSHPAFKSFVDQINRHDQSLLEADPQDDVVSIMYSESFEVLDYYKTAGWERDPDFISFYLVYTCWGLQSEKEKFNETVRPHFALLNMQKELSAAAMLNLTVSLYLWNYDGFQDRVIRNIRNVYNGLIPRP